LVQALTPASAADAAAAAAPLRPPGIFFAQDAAGEPATAAYAPPAYAQPAYAAPSYAAPAPAYAQQPIVDFEGGVRTELPLVCMELQRILGPEIHAAQAAGTNNLGAKYKARLCHIIGIIDLAFAHNV